MLSTCNDQFGLINLDVVQAVSAFNIRGKTTERIQRYGILFIGLSGVMFTANIVMEILEQLSRALDIGIGWLTDPLSVVGQFLSLVASAMVYVGFIYPSLKGGHA